MQVNMVQVASIRPYDGNAKLHTQEQIDNVADSIRQYGFVQPLVLDRDGVIIIGHCRFEAARALGLETVPCVVAAGLSQEQAAALRLADNKLNESEWDWDLLAEELDKADFGELDLEWELDDADECGDDGACDIAYMDFDGGGDGGGSRMSQGSKVRVVIGPVMFDLADPEHVLYDKCRSIEPGKAMSFIREAIMGGDLA